jgi:hypothetical protein
VSEHDFVFALEIDAAETGRILGELCSAVLGHVGYGAPAIAELTRAVSGALPQHGANAGRRCDVRFVAHGGELQIVVACPGTAEWRTTRPLPAT